MSAQEEVENIEDMAQYQLELVDTCERNLEEILDDFDKVVNMPNSNQSKKGEMDKLEIRLLELKGNLEFFKNSSGIDDATKEKLNTIYKSVKLQINELKYPGAESYFLPNTLNRGFSVKTPEPALPKRQGSANSFNIFSPRPQAQAPRAKGFNSLSPLGEAQFAQPQSYANSSNIFSPLAQAPKRHGGSKKTQRKRRYNNRKSRKSRG